MTASTSPLGVRAFAARTALGLGAPRSALLRKREMQWLKDPGAATAQTLGFAAAPTIEGTATSQDGASSPAMNFASGASSGDVAGLVSPSFTVVRRQWEPEIAFQVRTVASSITVARYWVGLFSADIKTVSTPTTQHVAAFRYADDVDGTAFWRCVTCDGSSNVQSTTTGVAVATGVDYLFEVHASESPGEVRFFINGLQVASHATHRPGGTQFLGYGARVTTLEAVAKSIRVGRVALLHR